MRCFCSKLIHTCQRMQKLSWFRGLITARTRLHLLRMAVKMQCCKLKMSDTYQLGGKDGKCVRSHENAYISACGAISIFDQGCCWNEIRYWKLDSIMIFSRLYEKQKRKVQSLTILIETQESFLKRSLEIFHFPFIYFFTN